LKDRREIAARLPRRDALTLLAGAALAGGVAVPAVAVEDATAGGTGPTILIVRHAEKPSGDAAPFGITEAGEQNAGSLTVRGWTRAGALAVAFAAPKPAWRVTAPAALFASAPKGPDAGLRAIETLTPLAKRLGLDIDESFARGDETALAARLVKERGTVLVAWEHHSIPALVAAIGLPSPSAPTHWKGDRFDLIWECRRTTGGTWRLRVVPQMLLAGDRPTA
jgi:hypothetical protein